tara:strand:- start:2983 stop:3861 length:879 start_codon:yes stop_codon:yes gene_type:complete
VKINKSSFTTIISCITTDKPVRKTSYQVKGVLMKELPKEKFVPHINGKYRFDFLYPRIQVKILNEKIFLIGIKEGVEPIIEMIEKLKKMNFGNITFNIDNINHKVYKKSFIEKSELFYYKFLNPWIALNQMNMKKFQTIKNNEKEMFLNKLLGQNIAFLAKEFNIELKKNIFVDIALEKLDVQTMEDGKTGSFQGGFKSNIILPNLIGIGNGITKGYGVIVSNVNYPEFCDFLNDDEKKLISEKLPKNWESKSISPDDIPLSKRKKKFKKKKKKLEKNEPNFNSAKYHSKTH